MQSGHLQNGSCSRPLLGSLALSLEVHHVNGDPMDNRISNTIPLCRDCHHKPTFPGI
jgi:5-methylcytosine-specific restriction endonuclease McrA